MASCASSSARAILDKGAAELGVPVEASAQPPGTDMIKILFKEDWVPPFADRPVFVLAPMIVMAALLIVFAIRLTKTRKFMPSGMMLVLTLAALALRHLAV